MPSIKECPKEIMTQSSGYVRLPLITNAVIDDERTFPVPLSRALIEDLPEDIKKEICYSHDFGMSSYSELDEPELHAQFDGLFSGTKSYYIRMEKYGEYIEAVSSAGKAFVGSLNNSRPLLEVDSKYFGLTDDAVSKATPPAIIGADERDKFSLIREPWGEKLAKQITLVLGQDMVRREEGSFNYYIRKDDKARLQLAMDRVSKAAGLMAAHGEMNDKVKAFENAAYWELSSVMTEIEKKEDKERAAMGEIEKLMEIKDPHQFIISLSAGLLGLGLLCYLGFGHLSYWGHRHSEWIDRRLFGNRARRTKGGGGDGGRGETPEALSARRSFTELLDGGVASEALTAVRTGLDISGDTKYGDAARLSEARKGLVAAKKALEALERAKSDAMKGRKR